MGEESYRVCSSRKILCGGLEGETFDYPVELSIEIGVLYSRKYTIFTKCQKEGGGLCIKSKNLSPCKFSKMKDAKLKEEFFPQEDIGGVPPRD